MTHADLVDLARSFVGVSANPAGPSRDRYLALIATHEDAHAAAAMAQMSGCGLFLLGLLRAAGSADPLLLAPYRDCHAFGDLLAIARHAGADTSADRIPELGDMIMIGDIGDGNGGKPAHVYLLASDVDASGAISAIEGGQRDSLGCQMIRERPHVLAGGWDASGPLRRLVRHVIDVGPILGLEG